MTQPPASNGKNDGPSSPRSPAASPSNSLHNLLDTARSRENPAALPPLPGLSFTRDGLSHREYFLSILDEALRVIEEQDEE